MTRVLLSSAFALSLVFSSSDLARAQDASSKKKEATESAELIKIANVEPGDLKKVVIAALELWYGPAKRVAKGPGGQISGGRKVGGVLVVAHRESKTLLVQTADPHKLARVKALVRVLDLGASESPVTAKAATGAATKKVAKAAPKATNPKGALKGTRVDITSGKIPVEDFLKFLSDYTGIPTVGSEVKPTDTIHVVSEIRGADDVLVKELLKASGWSMEKKTLSNGRQVLRVYRTGKKPSNEIEGKPVIRVPKKK